MNDILTEILRRLSELSIAFQDLASGKNNRKIEHILLNTEFLRKHATTYIGAKTVLTYLEDETPIYVNSNDFGPPANFINGGRYEVENLTVLMSFVRDDTVFLDIGANLGFYSLQVAQRNKGYGKIHAFEPHPALVRLARASAYINGYSQLGGDDGSIVVHQCGLGNVNREAVLNYPADHLGGGSLYMGESAGSTAVVTTIHRLDDFFGPEVTFDLAKIDVEGFELEVFKGMLTLIKRSANPIILFEKLGRDRSYESEIESILSAVGLHLFGISSESMLFEIAKGNLAAYDGYVVAAGDRNIELNRNHFRIFPRQFKTNKSTLRLQTREELSVTGNSGDILFHGPYWYLSRGVYKLTLKGIIDGVVEIVIAHHFGYPATKFVLSADHCTADFVIDNDLPQFEIICRAHLSKAAVTLNDIIIMRIG